MWTPVVYRKAVLDTDSVQQNDTNSHRHKVLGLYGSALAVLVARRTVCDMYLVPHVVAFQVLRLNVKRNLRGLHIHSLTLVSV